MYNIEKAYQAFDEMPHPAESTKLYVDITALGYENAMTAYHELKVGHMKHDPREMVWQVFTIMSVEWTEVKALKLSLRELHMQYADANDDFSKAADGKYLFYDKTRQACFYQNDSKNLSEIAGAKFVQYMARKDFQMLLFLTDEDEHWLVTIRTDNLKLHAVKRMPKVEELIDLRKP